MARKTTGLTLRTFYDCSYVPMFLADVRRPTRDQYDETLRLACAFFGSIDLAELTNQRLADWRTHLASRPGRRGETVSPATTNKHLRHLFAVINRAGPPFPGHRDNLGILRDVPWCRPLREDELQPRAMSADELRRILEATHAATLPLDSPGPWWRAAVLVAVSTGLRRRALLALRWNQVDLIERTLRVRPTDDKRRRERIKPLNVSAVSSLLTIRSAGDLVFSWPHCKSTFRNQWLRIQRAASIDEPYTWHDLKRTFGTWLSTIADPFTVQRGLDHASLATSKHYVDAGDRLRAAVEQLPLPNPQELRA